MTAYLWGSNILLYLVLQALHPWYPRPLRQRRAYLLLAVAAWALLLLAAYLWVPNSAYGRGLTLEALHRGRLLSLGAASLQLGLWLLCGWPWRSRVQPAPATASPRRPAKAKNPAKRRRSRR